MKCRIGTDTTIFPDYELSKKDTENWSWDYGYVYEENCPNTYLNNKIKWIQGSCIHNLKVFKRCLKYLVEKNKQLNYVRLKFYRFPSWLLPFYTQRWAQGIYKQIIEEVEDYLIDIGKYARKHKIRLTTHAPMTTVLNSTNPFVVENSKYALTQLTNLYKLMGYDTSDFHNLGIGITTHVGGKAGGIHNYIQAFNELNEEVKNCIQLENDDKVYTIEDCLDINAKTGVAVCVDLHHDWIVRGQYLNDKNLWNKVVKSWKNVRPKLHISMSRRELIEPFYSDNYLVTASNKVKVYDSLPKVKTVCAKTTQAKLRPHGAFLFGGELVSWLLNFGIDSDIMVEMNYCNLASIDLANKFEDMYEGIE